MTNYQVIHLVITLISLGIVIGVFRNKSDNHQKEIDELKICAKGIPVMENQIENIEKEVGEMKSNHNDLSSKLESINTALNQLIGKIDIFLGGKQ